MNRPVKFQLLVSCKEWIFFVVIILNGIVNVYNLRFMFSWQLEEKKKQQFRVSKLFSICLSIFNSTITNRIQSDKNDHDIFMTFHFDSWKCFELIHSNERMKTITK